MKKPKMLYASPFWPDKSGISEYSEVLVYGLSAFFDITLLVNGYKLENPKLSRDFSVLHYQKGEYYPGFDVCLYNIGNQPYYHAYMLDAMENNLGYIILHDVVLYYLITGVYQDRGEIFRRVYAMEGVEGIQIVKDALKQSKERKLFLHKEIADKLPLNREVLERAQGVFVHSQYAKGLLMNQGIHSVYTIPLVHMNTAPDGLEGRPMCKQFGIPDDAFVIGAVGFIAPTKQNELACKAVRAYNKNHAQKVYYVMIGEGDYVNGYLGERIIKTGFLPNAEYWQMIDRCDMVFNLRYPTNGETSATLIQCMGRGKPCVVTDIGWFSELPDDCVIKVPYDITADGLEEIIEKARNYELEIRGRKSQTYVNEHCKAKTVARYIYEQTYPQGGEEDATSKIRKIAP